MHVGATPGGIKYSALDQVNRGNVKDLEIAWKYRTGHNERGEKLGLSAQVFQTTPILADGVLVGCSAMGDAFAVNPVTGAELWTFESGYSPSTYGGGLAKCRGVSAWTDPSRQETDICRTTIIYGTPDLRVIALDSQSGTPCPDFGKHGQRKMEPGKEIRFHDEIQFPSPPVVVNGTAIFGSTMADIYRIDGPSGKVRAVDIRTGNLLWEFDPIPRDETDPAAPTWGKGSATYYGNANVWSFLSADPENDLVFLPTTNPGADFYGGLRPGENRYADSLVALKASTGALVWHFQVTHHDIWDYDLPAQPIVVDLERDGKIFPAVVQLTKQGLIFIFNRLTGEPLFPIEERPVPQHTDVAGEWLSPTQPFPLKPEPLAKHGLTPDDAWGFTPWDRAACRRKIAALRNNGIYTPPSEEGTILMPATTGGMNWGGGAVVPGTGLLITHTAHMPAAIYLVPREGYQGSTDVTESVDKLVFPQFGTPYVARLEMLLSPLGAPCSAPPWGKLNAVDLRDGSIKWQVPLGSIEKYLPLPIPWNLGSPASGGPIVTAGGLAFIAATMDDKFRAFDVETGKQLWQAKLPAGGQATPMTYQANGRQFIVIAAGGHPSYQQTPGDYVIAFALLARDPI